MTASRCSAAEREILLNRKQSALRSVAGVRAIYRHFLMHGVVSPTITSPCHEMGMSGPELPIAAEFPPTRLCRDLAHGLGIGYDRNPNRSVSVGRMLRFTVRIM